MWVLKYNVSGYNFVIFYSHYFKGFIGLHHNLCMWPSTIKFFFTDILF